MSAKRSTAKIKVQPLFKPHKLKFTVENPEVKESLEPKAPEEPPTVKKIARPANLSLAEQRRIRKQKKTTEFSLLDVSVDTLSELKTTG